MQGFVALSPELLFETDCPRCHQVVKAAEWKMPGLWMLARFACRTCGVDFFFDLPYSLGVTAPCYLDTKACKATPKFMGDWYATLTTNAWKNRLNSEVSVTIQRKCYGQKVCMVNCLYPWWGDAVNLLLRVNRLKNLDGLDVVVIINPGLEWLVPNFVSGIWVTDQSVSNNSEWNEAVDAAIKEIIKAQNLHVFLPITFQSARLTPPELQEACKIQPFPRDEWALRLKEKAVITFMARADRTWSRAKQRISIKQTTLDRFIRRLPKPFRKALEKFHLASSNSEQLQNIVYLADKLKTNFPRIEFVVCGVGRTGSFPSWIKDLRVDEFAPDTNRIWAQQAAQSHVFIGVHGSHTSLFASMAGSSIELTPVDRLKNVLQCSPITSSEAGESIYCYRFLPVDTSADYLSELVGEIILNYPLVKVGQADEFSRPLSQQELTRVREELAKRHSVIETLNKDYLARLAT